VETGPVRLAELVGGLAVVSDLARGLGEGQGFRATVMATRLAELAGATDEEREAAYWVGLLRFVGCTATAADMASALGDELAVSAAFAAADPRDLRQVLRSAIGVVGARPDRLLRFLGRAPGVVRDHEVVSCEVARHLSVELGLGPEVGVALGQVFERWDGKGNPGRLGGNGLSRATRLWQVAHLAELLAEDRTEEEVTAELVRRAGKQLDPAEVGLFMEHAIELLALGRDADLAAVLAAEPVPYRLVADDSLDGVLELFGLIGDLKAPCFRGHSGRVAALAADAAVALGLDDGGARRVRRTALVQDVGRVAVSSRVWGSADRLGDADREQVRLHPYFSQRVLERVPALRPLAALAGAHHERTDGSGYHRGLRELTDEAALLATVDRYVTACTARPHREAMAADDARRLLEADAADGRLPGHVVSAVLQAGDPTRPAPRPSPSGNPLTGREVDVLREVASGLTNSAAGRRLGISGKTVNTHLEHAYAKLDVSTRTAAVVIAERRGWLST
jgi:HD-GYP domain-containing protein (c-di-GMP phosphodiesterase class II)/DNA-binding CsgD family transcriptional regulator